MRPNNGVQRTLHKVSGPLTPDVRLRDNMKTIIVPLLASILFTGCASTRNLSGPEAILKEAAKSRWYSEEKLKDKAQSYIQSQQIDFNTEAAQHCTVITTPSKGRLFAMVQYSSEVAQPYCTLFFDKQGKVIDCKTGIMGHVTPTIEIPELKETWDPKLKRKVLRFESENPKSDLIILR